MKKRFLYLAIISGAVLLSTTVNAQKATPQSPQPRPAFTANKLQADKPVETVVSPAIPATALPATVVNKPVPPMAKPAKVNGNAQEGKSAEKEPQPTTTPVMRTDNLVLPKSVKKDYPELKPASALPVAAKGNGL